MPRILLLLLLLPLTVALSAFAQQRPTISDTIGYVYAGERVAAGRGLTYEDPNNDIAGPYFSLFAFQIRRADNSTFYLGFPPGFPLLLGGAIAITGRAGAASYVVPLFAAAGVALTFWLGTLLSRREWVGWWAAFLLAVTPVLWQFGTEAWSEAPAMALIAASFCLFLLARRPQQSPRRRLFLTIAAAATLTYGIFIRYANVAFLPAFALYDVVDAGRRLLRERWRWPFYAAIGFGLAGVLIFNLFYYGGPLLTSYSPAHGWYPQPAFSLAYALGPSFVNGFSLSAATETLWANFPFLLLLLPIGWLVLPRPEGILAASATLATVGLYAIYAFAASGVNSRFLLPSFPILAVAIAAALDAGGRFLGRWRWLAGMLLVLALTWPMIAHVEKLEQRDSQDAQAVAYALDLVDASEEDAVFLSYVYNDQLIYYGNRSVLNYRRIPIADADAGVYRWEMLEPCLVQSIDNLLDAAKPVYYVQDREPSYAGSLEILQEYYVLERTRDDPPIFRVRERVGDNDRATLAPCPEAPAP